MEPLIQHVRFFNGQFLRQQEFREEQGYLNHMRRRLNYVMLTDGVVEVTTADLTIVPVSPGVATDKRIRIKKGMAVGANQTDLFESREIILPDDSPIIDLGATFTGGTVWVTVNYQQTENTPVAVGATTENSRVEETAEWRLHGTLAAAHGATVDGDPFIIIGSVNFASMNISADDRQIARLRAALIAPAPSISLNPTTVTAGNTVTFTVTSSPTFNLSTLTPGNVSFDVSTGFTLPVTIVGTPAASNAVVRFAIGTTVSGTRTMIITIGAVTATATFTINAFVPPPTISSLAPLPAQKGNTFTIVGTNFVGSVSVSFNGATNVPLTSVTATQIQLTVPQAANNGPMTVTAQGGSVTQNIGVI